MPSREKRPLTEPMYYALMSFLRREMCGTEISEFVERKTNGRVKLGPGTLYTLLAKFQEEKLISETGVEGRKRTYQITDVVYGIVPYIQRLCVFGTAHVNANVKLFHNFTSLFGIF